MERDKASEALSAEIAERERLTTRLASEREAHTVNLQLIAEKNNALDKLAQGKEGAESLWSELQDELTTLKVSDT